MPRSTIARRDVGVFDKATELRNQSSAALSATTSETAVFIPSARLSLSIRCEIRALNYTGTFAAGSLQWAIAVEVSDQAGTGFVPIVTKVPNGTVQVFTFDIRGIEVEQLKTNGAYFRTTATKTGAPGNLTYGAFLTML